MTFRLSRVSEKKRGESGKLRQFWMTFIIPSPFFCVESEAWWWRHAFVDWLVHSGLNILRKHKHVKSVVIVPVLQSRDLRLFGVRILTIRTFVELRYSACLTLAPFYYYLLLALDDEERDKWVWVKCGKMVTTECHGSWGKSLPVLGVGITWRYVRRGFMNLIEPDLGFGIVFREKDKDKSRSGKVRTSSRTVLFVLCQT